jgi:hypothetical protein
MVPFMISGWAWTALQRTPAFRLLCDVRFVHNRRMVTAQLTGQQARTLRRAYMQAWVAATEERESYIRRSRLYLGRLRLESDMLAAGVTFDEQG